MSGVTDNRKTERKVCYQAGFLPVPLSCVPAQSLSDLEIYLATSEGYSLYNAQNRIFNEKDAQRLVNSNVDFVYISVRDHQVYFQTMEQALQNIVGDASLEKQRKAEILYSTSIELSNQLLSAPPNREDITRASNIARATVQMIMQDRGAFSGLLDTFNHDFYTATHLVNVCGLAITAAQKIGLIDYTQLQQIGTGGLLHDIGKIFIPSELLNKPGKLTTDEFEVVKGHVNHGTDHLKKIMSIPPELAAMVAEHHERIDGSGYPLGLRDEELSPLGRLAGIVDVFDAMTSARPYRSKTFSMGEALEIIYNDTPDKFDRDIFDAFAKVIERAIGESGIGAQKPVGEKTETPDELKAYVYRQASRGVQEQRQESAEYYFRMPIVVKRIARQQGRFVLSAPEEVTAHRLSCTHIGFLTDRQFKPQEKVLITSRCFEGLKIDMLAAVIVRSVEQKGGWRIVEARFLEPLAHHMIRLLQTQS